MVFVRGSPARLMSAIHSQICVKLSTNSAPNKPELKGTRRGRTGDRFKRSRARSLPGGDNNSLNPTGELSLQPAGFCFGTLPESAPVTAKGERRASSRKGCQGAGSRSPTT
jgi:hypothetical protein